MEGGGRQIRLLSRLLGKLRGEHHRYNTLDKSFSITSTVISESTGCDSMIRDEEDIESSSHTSTPVTSTAPTDEDHQQFAANIDLRYGGQYLTPEQLPEFCNQLHNLVEVIRNIQSYSKVTGEYPSELERRLDAEAREVAALAAEARNACNSVTRTRNQRRAVRTQRKHLVSHLTTLKEAEVRELESTVRLSDRKMYKSWETLKNTSDPSAFEPLLEEIRNRQTALDCLIRLVENRKTAMARNIAPPQALPPPIPSDHSEEPATGASGGRGRPEVWRRSSGKRRRKEASREPRSVPLSGEPSRHDPQPQVTLYVEGTECTSRYRVGSAGAVALTSLELPSHGSVRDILFFTSN